MTPLPYATCRALRDAGFPQDTTFMWSVPKPDSASDEKTRLILKNECEVEFCHKFTQWGEHFETVAAPTLSELIAACGEKFRSLTRKTDGGGRWEADCAWDTVTDVDAHTAPTPSEAVASLYLALRGEITDDKGTE